MKLRQRRKAAARRKKPTAKRDLKLPIILVAGLLSVVGYLGFKFYNAYQKIKLNQVYVFVYPDRTKNLVVDKVLLKSAVVSQPDVLVTLKPAPGLSADKNTPGLKLSLSRRLTVPVDEVVVVNRSGAGKASLIVRLIGAQVYATDRFEAGAKRFDIFKHLLLATSVAVDMTDTRELSGLFLERSLVQTGRVCSIAVVNTTAVNGLATSLADFLENNGLYVARITGHNGPKLETSQVMVDNQRRDCFVLGRKLKGLLPHPSSVRSGPVVSDYRADIVLLIGRDLEDFKPASL